MFLEISSKATKAIYEILEKTEIRRSELFDRGEIKGEFFIEVESKKYNFFIKALFFEETFSVELLGFLDKKILIEACMIDLYYFKGSEKKQCLRVCEQLLNNWAHSLCVARCNNAFLFH